MELIELFMLAVGVSMDAFAVSICRGVKLKSTKVYYSLEAGMYFGGFQALMPVIGYFVGDKLSGVMQRFDHWIAFILLGIMGIKMLKEAFDNSDEETENNQSMLILAIATSIDALAVGLSLALLKINVITAALFIGIVTFIFSVMGIQIGARFGEKYKSKAEIIGGAILIFIGTNILMEHLFF
ncbi:MAG: hypothetical protein ATN32_06845 [Candidatus Epulonipiscium fishelsonii]|nr:MAG: hypothetical protein ATN32_06845 [Epulopiscium sp. AS2M-Bin002]